jgi:hypothetical protein
MDELERFKVEINLTEYAASRGYHLDRRASSRNSIVMRHSATDDKIVVARGKTDRHWIYFSVRDAGDHGTIVDFVQRRDRSTLAEVRRELLSWIGADRPPAAPELYRRSMTARTVDRQAVSHAFEEAFSVSSSAYLHARGIRPTTLSCERFAGTFRQDAKGNVLFPHLDGDGLAGFESKNHAWTSFSPGGVKALWRSRSTPGDRRLVLVESAIDALSFHQLRPEPHTGYASTAGSLSAHQRALLAETLGALPPGAVVILAFDADLGGERLADQVRELGGAEFVRVRSPIGKDWNDCLKKPERDYIRSLGSTRLPGQGR